MSKEYNSTFKTNICEVSKEEKESLKSFTHYTFCFFAEGTNVNDFDSYSIYKADVADNLYDEVKERASFQLLSELMLHFNSNPVKVKIKTKLENFSSAYIVKASMREEDIPSNYPYNLTNYTSYDLKRQVLSVYFVIPNKTEIQKKYNSLIKNYIKYINNLKDSKDSKIKMRFSLSYSTRDRIPDKENEGCFILNELSSFFELEFYFCDKNLSYSNYRTIMEIFSELESTEEKTNKTSIPYDGRYDFLFNCLGIKYGEYYFYHCDTEDNENSYLFHATAENWENLSKKDTNYILSHPNALKIANGLLKVEKDLVDNLLKVFPDISFIEKTISAVFFRNYVGETLTTIYNKFKFIPVGLYPLEDFLELSVFEGE